MHSHSVTSSVIILVIDNLCVFADKPTETKKPTHLQSSHTFTQHPQRASRAYRMDKEGERHPIVPVLPECARGIYQIDLKLSAVT